ncbi:Ctf8 domain containing protein [Naviculisporaceae sp. PSN 640]
MSPESSSTTPSITLHLKPSPQTSSKFLPLSENPLPNLIQTPSGLAILELQGTFNTSDSEVDPHNLPTSTSTSSAPGERESTGTGITELGHITFPDYKPDDGTGNGNTAWMKKVYMFVGNHQRLAGEVKKLPRPLGVVVRRRRSGPGLGGRIQEGDEEEGEGEGEGGEDLEVLEVVKYKLVFSSRPEPVTETSAS